jgi:gas vesicle protein
MGNVQGAFGTLGMGNAASMFSHVGAASAAGQNLAQATTYIGEDGKRHAKGLKGMSAGDKVGAVASTVAIAGELWAATDRRTRGGRVMAGASTGSAAGAAYGPIGAAVGAVVGAVVGLIHNPKWAKAADNAGKFAGYHVSDEMGKAIMARSKELGISVKEATVLALPHMMTESGKDARTFGTQIQVLMDSIKAGSIPAKEGIAALGSAFTMVSESATKANAIGDKAMTDIIRNARAAGLKVPEIQAYVSDQLARSVGAMGGITGTVATGRRAKDGTFTAGEGTDKGVVGGINIGSAESAAAQATIFSATFWATVESEGLVAGVDAMAAPFAALREKLTAGGFDAQALLGPMADLFALLGEDGNQAVRSALEGVDALKESFEGVANAGYMTVGVFGAYEVAAKDAFDQAIAGGLDSTAAFQAIGPLLQSLVEASRNTGIALDATTQGLVDQAMAAGVSFPTTPIDRMEAAINRLVITLGGVVPAVEAIGTAAGSIPAINIPVNIGGGVSGGPLDTAPYAPSQLEGSSSAGGYGTVVSPKRVHRMTRFLVHPNEGVAVIPAARMSSAGGFGFVQGGGGAGGAANYGGVHGGSYSGGSGSGAASLDEATGGAVRRARAEDAVGGAVQSSLADLRDTIATLAKAVTERPAGNVTLAPQIVAQVDMASVRANREDLLEDVSDSLAGAVRRGTSGMISALEQQGFRRGGMR